MATSGSPHTGAKNRTDVCETAAIYSLSLLALFLLLSPRIAQVSRYNSQSLRQLAIRMSFVGRLRGEVQTGFIPVSYSITPLDLPAWVSRE